MTIIACSSPERLVIADTRITSDEYRFNSGCAVKIVRCPDGSIGGSAGDTAACVLFLEWLRRGRKGKAPAKMWEIDKEVTGLVLTGKGEILCYSSPTPDKMLGNYCAIGYGAMFCLAALKAGATLLRSVEIACELSGTCGGPFTEMSLSPMKRKPIVVAA